MIKSKITYITIFMLLLFIVIINGAYAEDIHSEDVYSEDTPSSSDTHSDTFSKDNSQFDIRFANTLSVGYFSNCLYNDIRSKHSTILDKPAFNIDEKFQIILSVGNRDEIETADICCMSIPNSLLYLSINLLYSHHENFAVRTGVGFEGGFGDYKNPFLSGGIYLVYIHDMVFNNKSGGSLFFNIGYKYDMHLFFDFSGVLNDINHIETRTYYYDLELTLGYKKLIPLFLKIKGLSFINDDDKINYTDGIQYSYQHDMVLIHIQYYGDNFGLSIGVSGYQEYYIEQILNDKRDLYIDYITIEEKSYTGGGMTFYIKNKEHTFELFGEFHLLADNKNNWMTMANFGSTIYF